jgi:uncharacterized RDD family membrane protein YckC
VTRAVAFLIDALIITFIALGGVVVVISVALILHLGHSARVVIGAVGAGVYVLWAAGYHIVFWTTTGQTPGGRAMRFTVRSKDGGTIGPLRASVRWLGVVVSALLLGLGFVPILFDKRRRGLQDLLAGTVAVNRPEIGDYVLERVPVALEPAAPQAAAAEIESPVSTPGAPADKGSERVPADAPIQSAATRSPLIRYG